MNKSRKSVKLVAEEEYNIPEELSAEARRLANKIGFTEVIRLADIQVHH